MMHIVLQVSPDRTFVSTSPIEIEVRPNQPLCDAGRWKADYLLRTKHRQDFGNPKHSNELVRQDCSTFGFLSFRNHPILKAALSNLNMRLSGRLAR